MNYASNTISIMFQYIICRNKLKVIRRYHIKLLLHKTTSLLGGHGLLATRGIGKPTIIIIIFNIILFILKVQPNTT